MKKLLFASLLGFGLFCSCTHKLDVAPENLVLMVITRFLLKRP